MTTRRLKIGRNNTKIICILYTKYNATKRKKDKNLLLGYGKYLYTYTFLNFKYIVSKDK